MPSRSSDVKLTDIIRRQIRGRSTAASMRYWIILTVMLCLAAGEARSQDPGEPGVRGTVSEADTKLPIESAHILLWLRTDSTRAWGALSRNDGSFDLAVPTGGAYAIRISAIGFVTWVDEVTLAQQPLDIGRIELESAVLEMDNVLVEARRPAMEIRGDTLEFSAAAYQTRPDAMAEDLVEKLPGARIQDGVLYINGEPIERIMLDGQEYFGTDVLFALQTLPVEIIASLQVYDKLSDQAEFTGFDDGNSQKTINIVTRRDRRNGQIGQAYGGMGSESRYNTGFNVTGLGGTRKLSAVGRSSNISSGNRRGQSAGGITKTHSLDLNYTDKISDKLEISGSYRLQSSNSDGDVSLTRQYFLSDNTSQFYDESNSSLQDNASHRVQAKITYDLDDRNAITFTPNISIASSDSKSNVTGLTKLAALEMLNSTVNENLSGSDQFSGSMNLLLRHRFEKAGRTISANLSVGKSTDDGFSQLRSEDVFYSGGEEDLFTRQRTSRDQNSGNTQLRFTYTEPVAENQMVELSYAASRGISDADRIARAWDDLTETYLTIEPGLSNAYDHLSTTHRTGLNYRVRSEKTNITLGVQYEDYILTGDQTYPYVYDVRQHFTSFIPNARADINFSKTRSLRVDYRARTRTPSVSQLQSVIDNSNPIQLSTGNPDLKQSTDHSLNLRYRNANPESGRGLWGNVSVSATRNYIGRASVVAAEDTDLGDGIILRTGSRLTRPINMDGLWQARGSSTFSFPIDFIKSNLNLDAEYRFNRSPGFINGIENVSRRHSVGSGASVRRNIVDRIDFSVEYSADYNFVENTVRTTGNDNYLRHQVGANVELFPWKPFEINSRFRLSHYSRADNLDTETVQWNAGVAYRFLKGNAGEFALSVQDILNQGNSFSRNVNELYVEDNLSRVLGRYLLFSFTYRVRQFGQ